MRALKFSLLLGLGVIFGVVPAGANINLDEDFDDGTVFLDLGYPMNNLRFDPTITTPSFTANPDFDASYNSATLTQGLNIYHRITNLVAGRERSPGDLAFNPSAALTVNPSGSGSLITTRGFGPDNLPGNAWCLTPGQTLRFGGDGRGTAADAALTNDLVPDPNGGTIGDNDGGGFRIIQLALNVSSSATTLPDGTKVGFVDIVWEGASTSVTQTISLETNAATSMVDVIAKTDIGPTVTLLGSIDGTDSDTGWMFITVVEQNAGSNNTWYSAPNDTGDPATSGFKGPANFTTWDDIRIWNGTDPVNDVAAARFQTLSDGSSAEFLFWEFGALADTIYIDDLYTEGSVMNGGDGTAPAVGLQNTNADNRLQRFNASDSTLPVELYMLRFD